MKLLMIETSKMTSENIIKFFGASLDALDIPEAVNIKKAYVETLSCGKQRLPDLRDPYALFRETMGDRIKGSGHQNLGRFIVDSWLTPKPEISDVDLIQEESYNQFLREDGFRVFAQLLKDFVKAHIFPHIPGMIGVDHSLTGGVLMALSERFGAENLGVIVFDVHTDAVPLPIRGGLVQYAMEAGLSAPSLISKYTAFDPYTAGNFLYYLIDKEIILPENLMIIGSGDGADKLRNSNDKRVIEYVSHYDALIERGVQIVSKDQLQASGPALIQKDLDQLKCSKLYISLDVDVSAYSGVLAARFVDLVGTDTSLILKTARKVAELLSSKRFSLAGLDVMEIDIHKIAAKLRSGEEDQTGDFIEKFTILFANG